MKTLLFLLALLSALSAAPEAVWTDWQWTAPVEIKTAGTIRLDLPPAVLDASRADLGDLRVLSPTGGETPYFLLDHPPIHESSVEDGLKFKTYLVVRISQFD